MGSYCFAGESSKSWSAAETSIVDHVRIERNWTVFDSDPDPLASSEHHWHSLVTKDLPCRSGVVSG
jgi:hypothetical protein